MGMPKLWGKDKDGNRGFLFSHVKTIYYNWASKILLSTKLDAMDVLIEEKVAKAMMSNQQVNATDKIPTSALAYAMSQNITKNTNDIAEINGSLQGIRLVDSTNLDNLVDVGHYYAYGGNTIAGKPTGVSAFGLEVYKVSGSYVAQRLTDSGGTNRMFIRIYDTHTWSPWAEFAKRSELDTLYYMSSSMTNSGLIDLVGALRYRHIYISSSYTGTFEVPENKTIAYYGTVFTSAVNGYGLIVLFGSTHVYTQEIANSNAMDWVQLA